MAMGMVIILVGIALCISIVAFILSIKGRKNPAGRGMGTAGLIISIITVTLIVFGIIFFFVFTHRSEPSPTIYPDIVEEIKEAVNEEVQDAQEMVQEVVEEVRPW